MPKYKKRKTPYHYYSWTMYVATVLLLVIVPFSLFAMKIYADNSRVPYKQPEYTPVEVEDITIIEIQPEIEDVDMVDEEYENNLYLLAHLIYAEAGSDWCYDEMQLYVGSVVLNRINHRLYPSTMHDVIYQSGQYSCIGSFLEKEPNQRAWDNAEYLLKNGSQLPANVIFQAEFTQGDGIYAKIQNMYFCYTNK